MSYWKEKHTTRAQDSFSLPLLQYYKPLNIRVALIGLEVWTNQDLISVSDNPHSTLAAFLSWRSKQLHKLPNDNAQLITSVTHSCFFCFFSNANPPVSHPALVQMSPFNPPLYLGMITSDVCTPSGVCPAGTNCDGCLVCPGGGRSRAPPSAWHLSKPCAPTTSQGA